MLWQEERKPSNFTSSASTSVSSFVSLHMSLSSIGSRQMGKKQNNYHFVNCMSHKSKQQPATPVCCHSQDIRYWRFVTSRQLLLFPWRQGVMHPVCQIVTPKGTFSIAIVTPSGRHHNAIKLVFH